MNLRFFHPKCAIWPLQGTIWLYSPFYTDFNTVVEIIVLALSSLDIYFLPSWSRSYEEGRCSIYLMLNFFIFENHCKSMNTHTHKYDIYCIYIYIYIYIYFVVYIYIYIYLYIIYIYIYILYIYIYIYIYICIASTQSSAKWFFDKWWT